MCFYLLHLRQNKKDDFFSLFFLFVLDSLWENDILVVEVPFCSVSFRSYVLCVFLSPSLSLSSPPLRFLCAPTNHLSPLLFIFLISHLFFFFPSLSLCLTDSLAVIQTSVLLMTCSVFLTFASLASVLLLLPNLSLTYTNTHSHTHCWPHPSQDRGPCTAPPVSLLAACCNQSL